MAKSILLEIVTPQRLLIHEHVSEAQIPAEEGEIGVRPDHAPLIATLGIGVLSYVSDSRRRELAVHGGLLEILPDHVRVLADVAERADEIDARRAEEAMNRANERLRGPKLGIDIARTLNALRRALARLRVARELARLQHPHRPEEHPPAHP